MQIAITDVEQILLQSKTELSSAMLRSGVPDAKAQSTVIKIAFDVAMQRLAERMQQAEPLEVARS